MSSFFFFQTLLSLFSKQPSPDFTIFRWFVCGRKLNSFHVGNKLVTANISNLLLLIGGRRKLQRPFSEFPPVFFCFVFCIRGLDYSCKYWVGSKCNCMWRLFQGCTRRKLVLFSCQNMSDNVADNSGISYGSGLHQLNEERLNISTALKPFEMDGKKRDFI